MTDSGTIVEVRITPLAFSDPPLLNADGVHEPYVLRTLIEVDASDGRGGRVTGLSECTGHSWQLDWLGLVGDHLIGTLVYETAKLQGRVARLLSGDDERVDTSPDAAWRRWADRNPAPESRGPAPVPAPAFDVQRVHSALEVALLDAQGRLLGVPVVDLLGGRVQDEVDYSAYLFYKWGAHPRADGSIPPDDEWGPALDPDGIVRQARTLVDRYGFRSLKLKGGVMSPADEIAALHALRREFPTHPLRLDPNTAWTVPTALAAADELEGLLEYLEDPVAGFESMGEVARNTSIPLATNMCVVSFDTVRPGLEHGSVSIVLGDHHYWGGLRGTTALGVVCETAGWGMSMHSNSHLGVSLAAMTHGAAATPQLSHACDTHYPWSADEDVVEPGTFEFGDGALAVPEGPGLGVKIDRSRVDRLHARYLELGREHRNDKEYMRRVQPDFVATLPRW